MNKRLQKDEQNLTPKFPSISHLFSGIFVRAMDDFKKRKLSRRPAPSERPQKPTPPPPPPPTPEQEIHHIKDEFSQKYRAHGAWNRFPLNFVKAHYVWASIIIVILVALFKMTWNVVTLAENFSVKEIVLSAFSEAIKVDTENHTNILLLGTGTEEHDGAHLTDTIMVASIDHDLDYVSMMSIPRDLYVEVEGLYGGNRINSVMELVAETEIYNNNTNEKAAYQMGADVLSDTVSDVLGIPIHYYARVDFEGFVEIVDALGGIDVMLNEALYDPYYPAEDGTIGFQTFSLPAGPVHLDGEDSLKYVRSRQTTSDFDRSARQQQTLQAIKERALSLGVLTNPGRLKNIYTVINDNFDSNLEWDEMVYLAKIADNFDTGDVSMWVLNDNPLTEGGFLYTPEREEYGGAFVLVPYLPDYSDIHLFADLVLMHPEVHASNQSFQVTNGTGVNGLATETMYFLGRFGFDVVRYGNSANQSVQISRIIPLTDLLSGQDPELVKTSDFITYITEHFIPAGFIMNEVPQEYTPAEWTTDADIILELGMDYANWMGANAQHFYK